MNLLSRAVLRLTIRLANASLANHVPVGTVQGNVCGVCRPLEAWPCTHSVRLTADRDRYQRRLEEA